MVALRERRARVSYVFAAPDLDTSSDEDGEGSSSGSSGSGSGTPPSVGQASGSAGVGVVPPAAASVGFDDAMAGEDIQMSPGTSKSPTAAKHSDGNGSSRAKGEGKIKGKGKSKRKSRGKSSGDAIDLDDPAGSDGSLSSGASSEFVPPERGATHSLSKDGPGKSKGKGKGKRGRAQASSASNDSDDDDAYHDEGDDDADLADELRDLNDMQGISEDEDGGDVVGGSGDEGMGMMGAGRGRGGGRGGRGGKGGSKPARIRVGPQAGQRTATTGASRNVDGAATDFVPFPFATNPPSTPSGDIFTQIPHSPNAHGAGGGGSTPTATPGKSFAQPTGSSGSYAPSDLSLLPLPYRALLKTASEALLPAVPSTAGAAGEKRSMGLDAFPAGVPGRWVARLEEEPAWVAKTARWGWVEVQKEGQPWDWEGRKRRSCAVAGGTARGVGWEAWEGEGWWPELHRQGASMESGSSAERYGVGAGKGKERQVDEGGPRRKEEIRLGLEMVGRASVPELVLLSAADAAEYLPRSAEVTVHLGPHKHQNPVPLRTFGSVALSDHEVVNEGYVFSAGGPIWGLDWCPVPESLADYHHHRQYLAITCLRHIDETPPLGQRYSRDSPAAIQIWSAEPPAPGDLQGMGVMRCELLLCVKGGAGMACKWMPMGAWDYPSGEISSREGIPKLGILAVLQLDGCVSLYSIPDPRLLRTAVNGSRPDGGDSQPIYLRCDEPLLRIDMPDAVPMCLDWMTGSLLAVGYSNGHVAIWDVVDALRSNTAAPLLPHLYVNVAQAAISSIAAGRSPPAGPVGQPALDADPAYLATSAVDGTFSVTDMKDPYHPMEQNRARLPTRCVAWSQQNHSPLYVDNEFVLYLYKIRSLPLSRSHMLVAHRGPLWDVSTSDYHTMVATAASDGSVILVSTQGGFHRSRKAPLYLHRLFEVDHDVATGHYRMTDNFAPETISHEDAGARKQNNKIKKDDTKNAKMTFKTGNWSPHVGVHKVAWNSSGGIGRAGMLASGTAAGLGRIDIIAPEWRKDFDLGWTR